MLIPQGAEVWSLNNCWDCSEFQGLPINRIFDLHSQEYHDTYPKNKWQKLWWMLRGKHWCRQPRNGKDYPTNWREHIENGADVVLSYERDDVPGHSVYPIDRVVKAFSCGAPKGTSRSPFMNTFHYMIALAVLEGYQIIMLYGLDNSDFEHRPDDFAQMFWYGVTQGRGILLGGAIPQLNPFPLYGYTKDHEALRARRASMLWRGIYGWKVVYCVAKFMHNISRLRARIYVMRLNRRMKRDYKKKCAESQAT